MKTIYVDMNNIPYIDELSVCLGFFDALHLGHQALINKAKELDKKVALLSMEPGPKEFFTNEKYYFVNNVEDKEEILTKMNVDYLIICKTSKEFYSLSPEEFIDKILIPIGAKNVICGYDFTFGKKALGTTNSLKEYANSRYNVYVCDPVLNDKNEKISSTLIKTLIEEGNVSEANKYLPRVYQVKGKVIRGNQIGRTIGFKTANLENLDDYIYPKKGVYACKIIVDGKDYKAMVNVGIHPTVSTLKSKIIEAHIIDEELELYNQNVIIQFIEFIRGEKKFDSLDALKAQLEYDKNYIRNLLK